MEAAGVIIEDQVHAIFGTDDDANTSKEIKDQGGKNILAIAINSGPKKSWSNTNCEEIITGWSLSVYFDFMSKWINPKLTARVRRKIKNYHSMRFTSIYIATYNCAMR